MQIVAHASEVKGVIALCCGSDTLATTLPTLAEQLELCQKSLTAYLETKRAEFPRFYFVSDPTLLEILSLGSDPPSVVPHFQSGLFDSLSNVTFDKVPRLPHCAQELGQDQTRATSAMQYSCSHCTDQVHPCLTGTCIDCHALLWLHAPAG